MKNQLSTTPPAFLATEEAVIGNHLYSIKRVAMLDAFIQESIVPTEVGEDGLVKTTYMCYSDSLIRHIVRTRSHSVITETDTITTVETMKALGTWAHRALLTYVPINANVTLVPSDPSEPA